MKFLKTNSGRVLSAKDSPIMRRWKREKTKRYLSKGLRFKTATFQTRGEDQRKDEDSRAGDPSYFISRWYITPCHAPSSLEYICVYIRRFAFSGSTSQPGRLTRWKNKGEAGGGGWRKGRSTGRYSFFPLMRVFAAREANYRWRNRSENSSKRVEIYRNNNVNSRKWEKDFLFPSEWCIWKKKQEKGRRRDEDIWMFESRWFLVKEEFRKDRKDKSWQFSCYNNRVRPRSTGRFEARKVSSDTK